MPHAIDDETYTRAKSPSNRKSKAKNSPRSREQIQLHTLLTDLQHLFSTSQLSTNLTKTLTSTLKTSKARPMRILSLGLGSISTPGKGQTRRLKQLVLLLAIRDVLENTTGAKIEIFAQDPVFTRQDELFLSTLSVQILRTPTGSSLGEASSILSPSTIIYSPFLTLEAYEQILLHSNTPESESVQLLIGDDFNALREKWPKHSGERAQVEGLVRSVVGRYRRRKVDGKGFWEEVDQSFPMAVYGVEGRGMEKARI